MNRLARWQAALAGAIDTQDAAEHYLVGCLVSSVTLRAPLLGQDKAHFAGIGRPF